MSRSNDFYARRVVLQTEGYRVIHDPSSKQCFIESKAYDALLNPQWNPVFTLDASYSKSDPEASKWFVVYTLLTQGVKP